MAVQKAAERVAAKEIDAEEAASNHNVLLEDVLVEVTSRGGD